MRALVATYVFFLVVYTLARTASLPCSPDLPVSWLVEDSAGASALAIATNCSGGIFDVEWMGYVEFPETIYVIDGTVLNITGAGIRAVADGKAINQFLNAADATVHISGLRIENCAAEFGGAIFAEASVVTFSETSFSINTAVADGGALYLSSSEVSWSGETSFSDNTAGSALLIGTGGAVVVDQSKLSWSGRTSFSHHTADFGGALNVLNNSDVSWSGETSFSNNVANSGGALYISGESKLSWSGETSFSNNAASAFGGALYVPLTSYVSWSGGTSFSNNTADSDGGALYVTIGSDVSWSGETSFWNNTAGNSGGALYIMTSDVSWSGDTSFSSNNAGIDGGAVYVQDISSLSWTTGTTFLNNSCKGRGGAVAVVGEVDMNSGPSLSSLFKGNTAEDGGGAIYMWGVFIGPWFFRTNFTANNSPRGGAVYSVSSGARDILLYETFPINYDECFFSDNRASATGGAIESSTGEDNIRNTVFEGNTAGTGGALRLDGSAVLSECTFVDNASDEDMGAAISNSGVLIVEGSTSQFSGNDFLCLTGAYQDVVHGDRYEKICDGCPVCDECEVEDEGLAPICVSQMKHTQSTGGDTTVEQLEVDAGYWRATPTSPDVLACYNEDACNGGVTGEPDFCQQGYEGPYCAVCSEGHSMTLLFTCTKCLDSGGGIAIIIVVAVFFMGAGIALCKYLVSGEMVDARQGIIHSVAKRLPREFIKIIVVVWQILTQFSSVAYVTYPDVYQRFLDVVNLLNFDALWIPSALCAIDVGFHGRLLMSTCGPLVAFSLLKVTFTVAKRRNHGSVEALQIVYHRHVSMGLLISFLVYSSVSATVFQTFACEDLDDGKEYLRADYRIECDSFWHQFFKCWAVFMVVVYPVGIPLSYLYLVCKNHRVLKNEVGRKTSSEVQSISDLWMPYKPKRYYYEVVECVRRILLTGVVVFIYPNTAAQVAVTLVIAFVFVVVSMGLAPYKSKWDSRLSLAGHVIVFMSMYVALLSKVDVSDERTGSQEVFAGILVAAHASMFGAVVVQTVFTFLKMREQDPVHREGPRPRVHCRPSCPSS